MGFLLLVFELNTVQLTINIVEIGVNDLLISKFLIFVITFFYKLESQIRLPGQYSFIKLNPEMIR